MFCRGRRRKEHSQFPLRHPRQLLMNERHSMKAISNTSSTKWIFLLLVLAVLAAGWSSALSAQTSPRTQLIVKISDPSGALIPDAEIVLVSSSDERKFTTGSSGTVEASGLATGEWTMTVRREGFTARQRPVVIGDTPLNVAMTLEVSAVKQSVNVEGQRDIPVSYTHLT